MPIIDVPPSRKALTLRRTLILATVACTALALGCSDADEPPASTPASFAATATVAVATPTPALAVEPTALPTSSPSPTPSPVPAHTPAPSTPVATHSGAIEVERGTSARPEVALTFDCGWRAEATPEILRILEEENVVTTWFMMGIWAEAHPDLTKRIAAKHELATHSWDHPDYRDLTDAQIAADLKRTDDFLRTFSGRGSAPIWRAPSAARDQRVLDAAARAGWPVHVFWTTGPTSAGFASGDSLDWTEASAATVRANLLRAIGLGGGSILVVHCDAEATRDVLREVVREYRKAGLEFVTVSQLLRP